MGGIVGFISKKERGHDNFFILKKMAEMISHRGPHHSSYWLCEADHIYMSANHIYFNSSSHVNQLQRLAENSRFVMSYDGQILNHKQIQHELENEGIRIENNFEINIALESIIHWGLDNAIKKFKGMYAIVIWDKRDKKLFLVRDRMGMKPLYICIGKELVIWASELSSLYHHPQLNRVIDYDAVASYLKYLYIPCPASIFKDVNKVRPGTYVIYEKNKNIVNIPYWEPNKIIKENFQKNSDLSNDELLNGLESLLKNSINELYKNDKETGVFLSGGIDSSLIASVTQSLSSKPIKTFSLGFRKEQYNEAYYAKRIAEYLGTDHTEIYLNEKYVLNIFDKFVEVFSEPFADYASLPGLLLARMTKEKVQMVLSGDGGDELFGGYYRYFYGPSIFSVIRNVPVIFQNLLKKLINNTPIKKLDKVYELIEPLIPSNKRYVLPGEKLQKVADIMGSNTIDEFYNILISCWQDPSTLMNERVNPIVFKLQEMSNNSFTSIDKMKHCDLLTYLPDAGLTKVDRTTMAYSLECRFPLLDHEIVEWSWTLPEHFRISKNIMKKLLGKYLPYKLFLRPKMGFAVPIDEWLRGPLMPMVKHYISPKYLKTEGMFNYKIINSVWDEFLQYKKNHQYRIWAFLVYQRWKERWMK